MTGAPNARWCSAALWVLLAGCVSAPELPAIDYDTADQSALAPDRASAEADDAIPDGGREVGAPSPPPEPLCMDREACNGRDDDCDGVIDEFSPGELRSIDFGVCDDLPIECRGGQPTEPDLRVVPGYELDERTCDGLDNDCDNVVDESHFGDLGQPCGQGQGICFRSGVRICDPRVPFGPTICSAAAAADAMRVEKCNGLDDDCDGTTDEGIGRGEACPLDARQPCAPGRMGCADGQWRCLPDEAAAREVCNGVDDDCDGRIDEDGPQICAPFEVNPGSGTPLCIDGECGVGWCNPGSFDSDGAARNGCECTPRFGGQEHCNGLDDDCDGEADAPLVEAAPAADLDEGLCAGLRRRCVGGAWREPSYPDDVPGFEAIEITCDRLDNDCDGAVDEGLDGCR